MGYLHLCHALIQTHIIHSFIHSASIWWVREHAASRGASRGGHVGRRFLHVRRVSTEDGVTRGQAAMAEKALQGHLGQN